MSLRAYYRWLLAAALLLFVGSAIATDPVSCSHRLTEDGGAEQLNGEWYGGSPDGYYSGCRRPDGVVWMRGEGDYANALQINPGSAGFVKSVGTAYASYQEAEDVVSEMLIDLYRDQLDPSLAGCQSCRTFLAADRAAIVANLNSNTHSVCLRVERDVVPDFYNCEPVSPRPSLVDPTNAIGAMVKVFNPVSSMYGTHPQFNITTFTNLSPNPFNFAVVNRAVCLNGWKAGWGRDVNNNTVLACYLPSEGTTSMGLSGLDRTTEGACASCNPVNLSTGAKMDYAVDYQNFSPFPIVWERYYLSSAGEWRFSYERSLRKWTEGSASKVEMFRPDGSLLIFRNIGSAADPWYPVGAAVGVLGRLSNAMSGTTIVGYDYTNLHDETEHYDVDGRLISISDRRGLTVDFDYDSYGKLIRVDDSFGRYLAITRSTPAGANSWVVSITDGERTISYDQSIPTGSIFARPLLNEVTQADSSTIKYLYDENGGTAGRGLLTGIIGQDNIRRASYTYDASERVTGSVWDPDGYPVNQIAYEYDTTDVAGKPTKISWGTDSSYMNGQPADGVYKGGGFDEPCLVCAGGNAALITYDGVGNPTQVVSHTGVTTSSTYNSRGLPTRVKEADGTSKKRTTNLTWNADFRLPATVTENAYGGVLRTTTNTYNTSGQLTQVVVSTNGMDTPRSWTYTYNSQKLLETATAPDSRTTTYAYDANGNLLSVENAMGQTTTYGNYTADGMARLITDPNGLQTKLTYDAMRHPTKIERGSASTHWETIDIDYNIYGQVERIDFANGDWLEYTYNNAHRLTNIRGPEGIKNTYRDSYGKIVNNSIQDNNYGWMWWRWINYDRDGNPIETGGNQSHDSYEYDDEGRLTAHNDLYQSTRTERSYDALGRLTGLIDENAGSYQMLHDPQDQVIYATDSRGNSTEYSYNGFGDLVGVISPDSGTQIFTVNDNGEMLTRIDARGASTTITRDSLGRPTQVVFDDAAVATSMPGFKYGAETQTFTYDTCTNGIGRLCAMTDETGATSYSYDLWGRLTGKDFTPAGTTLSLDVVYGYSNAGELTSIQYPSGKTLAITNSEGDARSLTYDSYDILHGATYRPFHGRSLGWEWGGGLGTLAYGYNGENQQKSIEGDVSKYSYSGGVGRMFYLGDNSDSTKDAYLMQDGKDQLTTAYLFNRPDPLEFTYDANGNRTHLQADYSNGYDYTIDSASNRLTATTLNSGTPNNWTHDVSGNLIQEGFSQYAYGAKGRMSESSAGGATTTYAYNAHNQRQRKTRVSGPNTGTDYFIYDEEGRLLGVYDGTGAMREELVWFDGWRPVASIRPSVGSAYEIYRITSDHLGAPLTVRDDNGVKVWEWDAREPFGHQLPNQDPDQDSVYFELDLRFPGQWLDHETGLYHNGAREYSPKVGRYIQSDPLGLEAGWNTYTYVGNNPGSYIDPLGLQQIMVSIWIPREGNNSKTGHVLLSDMSMKTTYSSPFPRPDDPTTKVNEKNQLTTLDMAETRYDENRLPDAVYAVEVPDMPAFLRNAERGRSYSRWSSAAPLWPGATNCMVSALSSLRAGGVFIPYGTFMPSGLNDALLEQSKHGQSVKRLFLPESEFPQERAKQWHP